MTTSHPEIPNVLWNYWESDLEDLPPIVVLCQKSWATTGDFAEINRLGPHNISKFLAPGDLPSTFSDLPPVRKADAVRLALLARYGGFWADAGILTTASIHSWVQPKASSHGFFVFQDVDKSRIMDNWFIGSHSSSPFLQELNNRHTAFFARKRIHEAHSLYKTPSRVATHSIVAIKRLLGQSVERTAAWAKFPLSSLPMYPYFVMHYMANAMLDVPSLREEFGTMSKVSAREPLALRKLVDQQQLKSASARRVKSRAPLHKLNTYREYSPDELRVLSGLFQQ